MRFTPRECSILDRMRLGETYKEMAQKLGICEGGLKLVMYNLYSREEFRGPKHALALYVEWRTMLHVRKLTA